MTDVGLAWRLARRELRAGLAGFRVFLACLALGAAAIAGVGSLSDSLVAGLEADGRRLLGGDVDIRLLHRTADAEERGWLEDHAGRLSRSTEMRAMAEPAGGGERTMVELKGVDAAYPLVGSVASRPAQPLSEALDDFGALVDETLLTRLDLAVGDRLEIGEATFTIRGTVVREPDRVASLLSFGPRVLVADEAIRATGLVRPGSQIRYHYRVLLPEGVSGPAWTERLEQRFPEAGWRVRTPDKAAPGVERFLERMTLFLTFVGLTVLVIGGIGVANGVAAYLDGKTATIATFKCVGAPGNLVFKVYFLQILALGALGVLVGLAPGAAAPWLLGLAPPGLLPVEPVVRFFAAPLALAALFGLLVAVTFALWPLARAREIPAAALFRARIAPTGIKPARRYRWLTVAGVAALAGLTIVTASERYFAYWFVGGTLATFALLRLGALGIVAAAKRLHGPTPALRLVLGNLHRPGTRTPSVVVSLGAGLSVLVAVALIQGNLGRQIAERLPDEAPAFFFIDIQPHQAESFRQTVTAVEGTKDYQTMPSLRGRITAIDGTPVDQAEVAPDAQWAVRGDRAFTYAAEPPEGAAVAKGAWWPADYDGPPLISLADGVARGFGVGVGDTLTVNVLGRDITAEIANLRDIDWRSLRFGFAVIFAPGTLEKAPHTFIAAVHCPPDAEAAVEKAIAGDFPNVTAIRVREALTAASDLLAGVGGIVRGIAAVTLLAGALVLGGAIAAGHRRRTYDSVIFKVLGATRRQLLGTFVLEYGALGLATGVVGTAVGTLTAWAVVVFLMDMRWVWLPGPAVATALGCLAVTVAGGFIGTWRALGQKAAPHLRNE